MDLLIEFIIMFIFRQRALASALLHVNFVGV